MNPSYRKAQSETRRHFFKRSGLGFGAMALQSLLSREHAVGAEPQYRLPAKAKSVIYLHMAGSPSQIDLFEHKPELSKFHGKDCPQQYLEGKRFAFIKGTPKMLGPVFNYEQKGQTGQWISELLPQLSTVIDDVCVIRSMHTEQFNHSPAQLLLQTGNSLLGSPAMGSWVTYGLGSENEDLPGFSGAGLYDSYTHKPDEGHLSKSIKQVYASLWNDRAFEEREFYRVDHLATAMGVLLHPNFKDERANGVAVTEDILYEEQGFYYINAQVGEDLVTNPEESSVPEETLLGWWKEDGHRVVVPSNRTESGEHVLSPDHLSELRRSLAQIHGRFAKLYDRSPEDRSFAMEVEFKITNDNNLVIKQARPWVFSSE